MGRRIQSETHMLYVYQVEMGQRSDFTIRSKPNIRPSSPNDYRIFGQTLAEGCLCWAKWRHTM